MFKKTILLHEDEEQVPLKNLIIPTLLCLQAAGLLPDP